MEQPNTGAEQCGNNADASVSLLEQVTPLTRQINCLEIERIADVCVKNIPSLVRVRFSSLYLLDETNNILHLHQQEK